MDFDLLSLTTSVVVAHQEGPGRVSSETALLNLIRDVGGVLLGCKPGASGVAASVVASLVPSGEPRRKPVPTEEALQCLECDVKFKMLKRHLLTVHSMTPEGYRLKHNLAADAPMVTREYAGQRSELAKASGLGRTPKDRQRIRSSNQKR